MGIVKYHTLKQELSQVGNDPVPNLYLICGEAYLIKKAFDTLSKSLLGIDKNQFSVETLDGTTTPLGDIIEQVTTFSFPVTQKIIIVKNCPLFQSDKSSTQIRYSIAELDRFANFIETGWPVEHFLVLTSEISDKRKKIYKIIAQSGTVIDCTVAKGARKIDIDEQRSVLSSVADQVLSKNKKRIDNQAFQALVDMTGFNLDVFTQNLEKLSIYTADRASICLEDVKTVVVKDKKDPIFNLTNAIMEKDAKASLYYLNSLFDDGFHPLQILKSLENLFRKFLYVKDSLMTIYPSNNALNQMTFNQFKQAILPKIVTQDKTQLKKTEALEKYLTGKELKKKDIPKDLFLAPNPKNAYPVFQTFKKSENFSTNELYHTLLFLSDLDYQLKTSSVDAKTQIESLIIKLCSKGEFVYAQKNQDYRHYI